MADLTVNLTPHVTEKATTQEARHVYVFRVASTVGKLEMVNAVRARYGVTPVAVRMLRVTGKTKRFGQKLGKRRDWKKAYVTLATGDTITIAKPKIEEAPVTNESAGTSQAPKPAGEDKE